MGQITKDFAELMIEAAEKGHHTPLTAWEQKQFAQAWLTLNAAPPPLSPPATGNVGAETVARQFHDAYERLAPSFGYETRPETRAFDPESPNGKLMTAVCAELFAHGLEDVPAVSNYGLA